VHLYSGAVDKRRSMDKSMLAKILHSIQPGGRESRVDVAVSS
jgi:hypothetical protein